MNRSQNERLRERALLCCSNLAYIVELFQYRPLSSEFQARLNQEALQEIRTLETILETLERPE